jgi:hypothetical protein
MELKHIASLLEERFNLEIDKILTAQKTARIEEEGKADELVKDQIINISQIMASLKPIQNISSRYDELSDLFDALIEDYAHKGEEEHDS